MVSMLIDIHVHLQLEPVISRIEEVVETCRNEGVGLLVCNGAKPDDWDTVQQLSETYPEVIPCFGVHPWYADTVDSSWENDLITRLDDNPKACVGEIGIDRWITPTNERLQEQIFRRQLQIAAEFKRPAMIHCLRAWDWLMEILKSEMCPHTMLIHAYGGSAEMIKPLSQMGAYFSFAGDILDAKRVKAREALKAVPINKLLIETDAPSMDLPQFLRKYDLEDGVNEEHNHPANISVNYNEIARMLNYDKDKLAHQVYRNAQDLLMNLPIGTF